MFLSSYTPWLSGIFTGSVLVIVLSFCGRPAVTTVFSHTVWAKPRCDSDFQNSVCVTVPGSPVPPQKQTWFSFPKALMGPLFSPCCSTSSSLYKFIFGEFFISFFSLGLLLRWGYGDVQSFCISDHKPRLWWMSCFLQRFLLMVVTIHLSSYRHCTLCCYVMGLLFYAELTYTLIVGIG